MLAFPPASSIFFAAETLNEDAVTLTALSIDPLAKIFTGTKMDEIRPFYDITSASTFFTLSLEICERFTISNVFAKLELLNPLIGTLL